VKLLVLLFCSIAMFGQSAPPAPESKPPVKTSDQKSLADYGFGIGAPGAQTTAPEKGPRVIHQVGPNYPADALRVANGKVVQVLVTVQPNGIPTNVRISKGVRQDVDKAVVDAVQKWRFKPATRDGKPVQAGIMVQVELH
jgi:TonB family protein